MEKFTKNIDKIAVLISDDFIEISADEGQTITLEFTVENQSEMAWPFKPLVLNEREPLIRQQVNAMIKPG